MTSSPPALFTAGHGFYQFAVSRAVFDRSLYYNLLLQPTLAIPDHYLLQGAWVGAHLESHPDRDSWLECGLRNGYVQPYFRREGAGLSDILTMMEGADRRGFGPSARDIAERLDRGAVAAAPWSSATNSESFGRAVRHYLGADEPPMMDLSVDPDDFGGFWTRSRDWVQRELEQAADRSSAVLGTDGLLLSQVLQVAGERVLGSDCGRIATIDDLLRRARTENGPTSERDLRAYFSCLCEIYNRSLADTIGVAPNSPRWERHVAAMDLWREDVLRSGAGSTVGAASLEVDIEIRLPRPHHLRAVSGDVLTSIRRSAPCERYFESLRHWQREPHRPVLKEELTQSLGRYAQEITKQVGKDVGALGLRPQFISKASDVSRLLEKAPGVVHGFLAVGATAGAAAGTAVGTATGSTSPAVPAGLFTLLVLQTIAKYVVPARRVDVTATAIDGVRIRPDVTITRALPGA